MEHRERIVSDYKIMLGKPVIKGTRITVELILKKMSEGATQTDVLAMYPHLDREDIDAVLTYASEMVANEEVLALQR